MVRSTILTALLACNAHAFVAPRRASTQLNAHAFVAPRRASTQLAPSRRADRRAPTMAARVPWRTVFLAEYGGPIAIFPAVAAAASPAPSRALDLATGLWADSTSRRFLETLFVHSFSKSTMPLSNLFKNCGYYYSAAALVAWDMAVWSRGKLKRYRRKFYQEDAFTATKALIPFVF
ncbi:very-long-chain enoyl-CoA reductase [Aureococcus anophagefferens]|uniref:Very-long-chain enoyl-CoA reductase n=1 Tax=Aureococcus anophagefferens TaxID=44056 RepID=A0ABR1GCB3_AURAN